MYLSRVTLKPEFYRDTQLGHVLNGSRYSTHQLLWSLFPNQKSRQFLFRQEVENEQIKKSSKISGKPIYYILSAPKPIDSTSLFSVETKPFSPKLEKGDLLSFRLRANPVVSKKEAGKKNSKQHDVVMNAKHELLKSLCKEQSLDSSGKYSELVNRINSAEGINVLEALKSLELPADLVKAKKLVADRAMKKWLCDKLSKAGVSLVNNERNFEELKAVGYRWNALPEKSKKAGFSSVDYEGIMQVQEPSLFIEQLEKGFGRAKAIGCGLMLIRRI